MKKIYAYYQSIQLSNQPEEFACANWWKQSWEKLGWQTSMLNRSHAQASPLYNKLTQKLMNTAHELPPELATRFDWIIARYIRWCALHGAGGGWMSDYDVLNKGFNPEIAEEHERNGTLHINNDDPAYVFYATQEHCANVIRKFIQEPLIEGNKVLHEAHILDIKSGSYQITKLLHHSKSTSELTKSKVMEELYNE